MQLSVRCAPVGEGKTLVRIGVGVSPCADLDRSGTRITDGDARPLDDLDIGRRLQRSDCAAWN
jgi:hypothetical protein